MGEDLEKLKQRLSLLDYLRQQNWVARPAGHSPEFVGLCPLHPDTRPSFYVNASKNLFYCHGCGQGGDRYPEALGYLKQRGLYDPTAIQELHIGYAPGGSLRRHLTAQGYSCDLLQRLGLINLQGGDAFYRRVIFPCCQGGRIINLYGHSIVATYAHRFLSGSKGGLYAWEQVQQCPEVILVEGLFDYAVLWQAGFRHVTYWLSA